MVNLCVGWNIFYIIDVWINNEEGWNTCLVWSRVYFFEKVVGNRGYICGFLNF